MAASITGNVINQRTIQPIGGASLQLSGSASQNTTSGTDGKFAFNNLAEGNYDLLVTKDGFENGNYGPLVVFDGITLNLHLALQYEMTWIYVILVGWQTSNRKSRLPKHK